MELYEFESAKGAIVRVRVHDDIVDALNEEFFRQVQNIPHAQEYIIDEDDVFNFAVRYLYAGYTGTRVSQIELTSRFMNTYFRGLGVDVEKSETRSYARDLDDLVAVIYCRSFDKSSFMTDCADNNIRS